MPQFRIYFGYTANFPYEVNLTISANATCGANDDSINATLSIDAVAELTPTYEYHANPTLTISAASSLTRVVSYDYVGNVTLAAAHTIILVGGIELQDSVNIDAIADFILLPGIGYPESVTLDAVAEVTASETTTYGDVLDITADAAVTAEDILEPGGLLTISAAASITIETLQDFDITLPIEAVALFFPENVFDFVTSGNDAQASLTAAHEYIAGAPFTTGASAGVTVTVNGEYQKSITDSITFTDSVYIQRPIVTILDSISFSDSVSIKKVVDLQITDSITFTDEVYRVHPITDSITLTDTVDNYRVRVINVSDTITFTDAVTRQLTLNIGIIDTIVFGEGRVYDSPLNGQSVLIPAVTINVIKGKCQFVLTVPQRSILLPCPMWDDQQTYMGQVTIQKTTTGDTYSYIKSTELRKLQYVFKVDTQKRIELYEFLKIFSAEYITVDNHKGERWRAQLVNNPFSFDSRSRYAPRRESFDVTLEFEGIRIG